jgi:predicted AAA+ superfamily ATPase
LVLSSLKTAVSENQPDAFKGGTILNQLLPLTLGETTGQPAGICFLKEPTFAALLTSFEERLPGPMRRETVEACHALLQHGPFPEPFLRQNDRFTRKWHLAYFSDVLREVLMPTAKVSEPDKLEDLLYLMSPRVGKPLSMPELAGELGVAHTTVKKWLGLLERFYLVFPVSPWNEGIARALRKGRKWYFLDWHYAPDGPAKMENMVAAHLHRSCQVLNDLCYGNYHLHYVRTLDKRKIDFIVARNGRPLLAVETADDRSLSSALRDRRKWFPRTPTLGVQVVEKTGLLEKDPESTWVMGLDRFLWLLN